MTFRSDFLWGAASAAAQIEGAYDEDGRGLSIWDVLYDGHTKHNDSPHIACDHYHRMSSDVAMMKKLGLKAYRFSVSWSRILPDGTGRVNFKGIEFYKRLITELKKASIEPMITIYHWDLPYELYKKGGWMNSESVSWFEEYTKILVDNFSDEVRYWMTVNEPNCFIGISYKDKYHAPFLDDKNALYPCTRNVLLAHARAVEIVRERAKTAPQIGFAPTGPVYIPENMGEEALENARELTFSNSIRGPFSISWWIDPVVLGTVPSDVEEYLGKKLFTDSELDSLVKPLDFLGFNYYTPGSVNVKNSDYMSNEYIGCPRNSLGWPIDERGIYYSVKFLQDRYKLPILITENGYPGTDRIMLDGKIHDYERIDYVHRHLLAVKKAVEEGYDVRGYMYWSVMDNYEWAEGYDPRFGLIYVDYRNQERLFKDSAFWYADVIRNNGNNL
ncbi:MAG: glycoside hydrolase family 1 protein [Succinivibrio sp.]